MITVGTLYFNQPEMLTLHFDAWRQYDGDVEFIVIDDCSSVSPKITLDSVKVFRIIDDIPWNQSGARNLLHFVAENDWVMSTDCDHITTRETFEKLEKLDQSDELMVYFIDRKFSHGRKTNRMHSSFLCHRHSFLAVGGHDEDLAGRYGGVDRSWEEKVKSTLNYCWRDDIYVMNHSFDPGVRDANVVNLDRNPVDNIKLLHRKLRNGQPRGDIIRFRWERVR